MKKNKSQRKIKLGMAPGSIVFTGTQRMSNVKITLFQYNNEKCIETNPQNIEEAFAETKKFNGISWINIDGLHDIETIEKAGAELNVHKLTLEDILSVGQRPKIDEYKEYLYIVMKMFQFQEADNAIDDEQLSFILKKDLLISFQEKDGDVFSHVKKRLYDGKGTFRARGSDYLLYALMDSIVDYYFLVIEKLGERIEDLENDLLEKPNQNSMLKLHSFRSEILTLRRSVYPLREIISRMEKTEDSLFVAETRIFIRDLYDHTIQVIETIEVYRDMASSMMDLYMNSQSNKMNSIMKVLTIVSTIFIPLTFIVGVYGMNFNMPELQYNWAYYVVWATMIAIAAGMILYFKKKGWLN